MLLGRGSECGVLDELLDGVRRGEGRALVLRGEPGIGKTALLDYVVESARGFTVLRAVGFESETTLAYAGLQQLCAPLLDRVARLPEPRRDALRIAFGLKRGGAPDTFFVGLGVLGLLSEAADNGPLLCVIDNEQVLDGESAGALAFAAHRLVAESVAMVFATSQASPELIDLPDLQICGLREDDARTLLTSALAAPLDAKVLDRIVAETQGNPLALLELPKDLSPAKLAGGFGLPTVSPLSNRIEDSFQRRFATLPPDTQQLSLLAAAESAGDAVLVRRAAQWLGIAHDAAAPAAMAGLLDFGAQVRFRHPLARSAVYGAAPLEERRRIHGALAEVIDPDTDAARRAWHLAHSTAGADDDIADELERSAAQAQASGGIAAAAAFLEKSVELSADSARRGERALAAAQAKQEAGDPDAALRMLRVAETTPLDELQRARADVLRARVAFAVYRGRDAPALLLRAAERMAPLDATLTRQTLLDAFVAALFAGRLAGDNGLKQVAEATRLTQPCSTPPTALDCLLDGLALLITEGHTTGTPMVQQALNAFNHEDTTTACPRQRWMWLASRAAMELWDDQSWDLLSTRQVDRARQTGALSVLSVVLRSRFALHLTAGRLEAATMVNDELEALAQVANSEPLCYGAVVLAAWRGDTNDITPLLEASMTGIQRRGEGVGLTIVEWATAAFYNASGRYRDAVLTAEQAASHPEEFGMSIWALPELIEAAARNEEPDCASAALTRLSTVTQASKTHWALGIQTRAQALLSPANQAEPLYRQAIEHLTHTHARVDLTRAHLVYGEWLRRQKRRLEAREHLRIAYELFTAMGLNAFADRAARELVSTGATITATDHAPSSGLTPQEARIARLARDGLSNADIGSRLFISPRTVEYHLGKVYTKLKITSRSTIPQIL
jgi:DNA-binding CsgD family transcriptional regulator